MHRDERILNDERSMSSIYEFSAVSLSGDVVSFRNFEGRVLLVVNTASACGFTPQYKGLEALHREYAPRGLAVLGFPCNQFGNQEPGDAAEISAFCDRTYGVTFQLFAKVDVTGRNAHPLFAHLQRAKSGLFGSSIKWNFTKFLIDRQGTVVDRYMPVTTPERLRRDIERLL